jgi:hypothetical protein
MGYFKPPLRRSAARRTKREMLDRCGPIVPSEWSSCPSAEALKSESFVRFALNVGAGPGVGLFRSMHLLESDDSIPSSVQSQVRSTLRWFNLHVPVPKKLPRSAVCWFRGDSVDTIDRLWVLIEAYRMSGHAVLMQGARDPGRVVYHDDYQVAAIPRGRRPVATAL